MEKAMHQRSCVTTAASARSCEVESSNDQGASEMEHCNKQGSEWDEAAVRSVDSPDRQRADEGQKAPKNVHASAADLRRMLEKQGYKCAVCFVELQPETSEIDHIIPRSDGGDNAPDNLQWLCRPCNRAKGDMSMAAFIAMIVRIAKQRQTEASV